MMPATPFTISKVKVLARLYGAVSGSFSWTKDTGIGTYEVGLKFTITGYSGQIWKNWSYTISAGQTWLHMTLLEYDGDVIPWGAFIVEVDEEIAGSSVISVNASDTVNVTAYDDFGQLVFQNTSFPTTANINTYLRETLNVFTMNLVNQHTKPCYAVVTRSGVTWTSPAIGYLNSFAYRVYGSVDGITYTVDWYRNEDDHLEESAEWTVYQSDIFVYNGYQKPGVDIPPGAQDVPDFWEIMLNFVGFAIIGTVIALIVRGRGKGEATLGYPPKDDAHIESRPEQPPTPRQVASQEAALLREQGRLRRLERKKLKKNVRGGGTTK